MKNSKTWGGGVKGCLDFSQKHPLWRPGMSLSYDKEKKVWRIGVTGSDLNVTGILRQMNTYSANLVSPLFNYAEKT